MLCHTLNMIKNDNNLNGDNNMNGITIVNNHGAAMNDLIKMIGTTAIIQAANGATLAEEVSDLVEVTKVNDNAVKIDWV